MKITCIAVDDEPLALEKIMGYVKKVPYLELKQTFDNALDAMQYLKDNNTDLVFLDVQMEELTGIQMLEALHPKPCIVLTTAYDEYALKGYELDVCDYLLKPFPFPRFLKACEKVYSLLNEKLPVFHETEEQEKQMTFIFVKSGSETIKVMLDDILYIEGMKDYVRIWTGTGNVMTLLTFKKLEGVLPPSAFIRIHKSYIVAINKIDSIERNRVRIGDDVLPIGDTYRKAFFNHIGSLQ